MSITGSWWNQIRVNVPEYSRYDGLNAEWRIDSYDENNDALSLSSASLGGYTNTNVRWSDIYLDNSNVRFTLAKAVTSSPIDIVGPFSFDLTQPYAISGTNLSLAQEIKKGANYNTILVSSGASLINSGYLLFQYGYDECTGPVRCLGNIDDSTLMIDPGFKFPFSLNIGSSVNILYQRAAYEPKSPIGSFWLTASNSARTATIDLLNKISAAGIELQINTRFPGDRGLGNEGYPTANSYKLSDIVEVFGSDDLDSELEELRTTT
jgi:hypothetical protein